MPRRFKARLRAVIGIALITAWSLVIVSGVVLWAAPQGPRSGRQELLFGLAKRPREVLLVDTPALDQRLRQGDHHLRVVGVSTPPTTRTYHLDLDRDGIEGAALERHAQSVPENVPSRAPRALLRTPTSCGFCTQSP